jgi:hypothetical protein
MCGPESDTEQQSLHAEIVDSTLLLAKRRVKQLVETREVDDA